MSDVATLGIAFDGTQLQRGQQQLAAFGAEARKMGQAATDAGTAITKANTAVGSSAQASSGAVGQVNKMVAASVLANQQAAQATNLHASAHAGLSTQAMAAQHSIRGMVEQLALGVPVTQVLTQQLNHIAYAASGPGGLSAAFGQAVGQLRSLLSAQVLMVGGAAGLAAAMYLVYSAVKQTEIEFGNLSERTMTSVAALHALQSAGAIKGIGSDDFIKNMEKFGTLTSEAKDHLGSLAELFQANGVQAGTLEQNLGQVADLIRNARDEADKYRIIQQAGLPATREWVQFLSQGSAGVEAARKSMNSLNTIEAEALLAKAREFDEAWNKAWTNFQNSAKNAFLSVYGSIESLGDKATSALLKLGDLLGRTDAIKSKLFTNTIAQGLGTTLNANTNVDQFYKGIGAFNLPKDNTTINRDKALHDLQLEQQRVAVLGVLKVAKATAAEMAKRETPAASTEKKAENDCDRNRRAA